MSEPWPVGLLYHNALVLGHTGLRKQCRHRSDATECVSDEVYTVHLSSSNFSDTSTKSKILGQVNFGKELSCPNIYSAPDLIQGGIHIVYFFYFSMKTYVVGTHYKCLHDALLMSTITNIFVEK